MGINGRVKVGSRSLSAPQLLRLGAALGEHFSCPIIYGSEAIPVSSNDPPLPDPSHTHRWRVYVRGANGEDLSPFVRKVSFKLHESFVPATRVIESPPFEVHESGWGEFEILIKISFVDSQEKPMALFHQLQLYPKDEVLGGPDMDAPKQLVISEHYDELSDLCTVASKVINEPYEEFLEPLRRFRLQVHNMKNKTPPATFSPQVEANEIKKYNSINEKVVAEIERAKIRLAKVEAEKKKLEAEIRALEAEPA
ncbi:NuA4 histone H4 acetyltransferase complex and the SWR1 complex subunit [Entophlyctis luteolus]|nr:NuA4 histone H4 acetyltransferase complex and the SWR1 complex subunit [Entophlyctis luteolus]